MLVTPFSIVTLVKPLQPLNKLLPMLVTLPGIVTLVRPVRPLNALFAILVTENVLPAVIVDGITTAPEYELAATETDSLSNTEYRIPFVVIYKLALLKLALDYIVTDVNPLQLLNAPLPMLVTLSGIVTLVRPLQL